ncbi:hypothetical protein ACWGLG_29265 [Streptomyces antimycoticus]
MPEQARPTADSGIREEVGAAAGAGEPALGVLDSSRPFDCLAVGRRCPVESVGVAVPKEVLAPAGNAVNELHGHPISVREGFGALLAQFLTGITKALTPATDDVVVLIAKRKAPMWRVVRGIESTLGEQ